MAATTVLDSGTDAEDVLGGLEIIDCDSHLGEPADLWSSRAPARFRDRLPERKTVDGQTNWWLDGEPWIHLGGNTIGQGHTKVLGTLCLPLDEIDPATWSVPERLKFMDEQGVHTEVLYPNGVGFGSNAFFGIDDVALRNVMSSIYNDFFIEVQQESGGRLLSQGLLPIWDMDLTVAEMARLHDAGIRGFTLTDKPQLVGLPDINDDYFAPMWALANELDTVINFHIGSGLPKKGVDSPVGEPKPELYWTSFGPQRRLAVMATQFYMSNVRIITNLCMSDMFDRYPNVKVVSAESGIGWIPFVLEAMEYQTDEFIVDPAERALQPRRPTEYFRSNVYVTTWFERAAMKVLDDIGVGNVLVMTDIPHPTCLYPKTREHFAAVTAHLDPETRRRILRDNAAELYKIPLP